MEDYLAGFPVVTTIPLLWGDQDAFGHVNSLIYLRWCETARVEYLGRAGLWVPLPPTGPGPIVASLHCDYKRPLTFPGTIDVGARVTHIGRSSIRMEHRIVSRDLNLLAASADSTLVLLDYSQNRPVPVPLEIRQVIGRLERKNFDPAVD
ncbi:MAG TPA: thioesterase family protein [Bryobacteraceae bacterium]|nr:thioesterase family protein [Bryobacteraceae bacterium]